MALPAGVTTATVTSSAGVSFTGVQLSRVVSIVPSVPVTHVATGVPLVNMLESQAIAAGASGTWALPHVDQNGFQDASGASYKNWYYIATIQDLSPSSVAAPVTKNFQVLVGQTTVDLDLLPTGAPAVPMSTAVVPVTSVAGLMGAVTGAQVAAITELTTTYAPASGSANYTPSAGWTGYVATGGLDAAAGTLVDNSATSTWWGKLLAKLKTLFTQKGELFISVKDYGAKGDGTTDDTTAFVNAMAAVAAARQSALGMGYLLVPNGNYILTNLTIPDGVYILCNGARLSPKSSATGAMLTFNSSSARSGIENAYLAGGAYTGNSAITVGTSAFHIEIRNCRFDNWGGRAIYDQGIATTIENVFAQNCLLDANTLSGYAGVVELAGTDAWFFKSEITASRYSVRGMSTTGFACAFSVTGANNMAHAIVAETSDHGVYVGANATQSQFVGVRGELNYGHGWIIAGGGGEMVACHALRNSQAGNNLYNGFNITAPASFIGRALYSESGGTNPKQNYGLIDTGGSNSTYSSWDVESHGDNIGKFTSNSGLVSFLFKDNPPTNMDANTATPWGGVRNLIANNTVATNVTQFAQTVNGQRITIKGDGFTTLVNGASIATTSGSNLLLAAGTWYNFIVTGSKTLTQV